MAVLKITKDNYEKEVLNSKTPVLIDFWANWCMPCRMLGPIIEEISEKNIDVKICKIDIDEEMELAQKFQVMSIPTLVYVKEGKEEKRTVGVRPKEEIEEMIK
ncbi:MAG: thioredoxin [Fusobacterium sp. JB021]|nr:thioredoxin [Fusobacterium sp. JB021]MDP0506781.1 thioredoxin [Fusobacterium sp. JB019]